MTWRWMTEKNVYIVIASSPPCQNPEKHTLAFKTVEKKHFSSVWPLGRKQTNSEFKLRILKNEIINHVVLTQIFVLLWPDSLHSWSTTNILRIFGSESQHYHNHTIIRNLDTVDHVDRNMTNIMSQTCIHRPITGHQPITVTCTVGAVCFGVEKYELHAQRWEAESRLQTKHHQWCELCSARMAGEDSQGPCGPAFHNACLNNALL